MRRFVAENYPIDKLPRDLHPHMPAGRKVRVIIEDEISDEDLTAEFRMEIEKGLDDLDAGKVLSAEEVRTNLAARFNWTSDAGK